MSYWQLLDVYKHADQEFRYYANRPPTACPLCGEPLRTGPQEAENTLFCLFDGWSYPRDWTRPDRA